MQGGGKRNPAKKPSGRSSLNGTLPTPGAGRLSCCSREARQRPQWIGHPPREFFEVRSDARVRVDVRDERSAADALADAYGAVNAVSLYLERGQETFHSVHVESAHRVAAQTRRSRLIHVSGIGADPRSQSLYIRKRGEGELAVREAFADAILIRPAVMFGPNDAFLTTIIKLLNRLPIFPMFGNGQMRLQPVYVEDVG
jgi:uncharacterized protein YbjT (DUF2867 family)